MEAHSPVMPSAAARLPAIFRSHTSFMAVVLGLVSTEPLQQEQQQSDASSRPSIQAPAGRTTAAQWCCPARQPLAHALPQFFGAVHPHSQLCPTEALNDGVPPEDGVKALHHSQHNSQMCLHVQRCQGSQTLTIARG